MGVFMSEPTRLGKLNYWDRAELLIAVLEFYYDPTRTLQGKTVKQAVEHFSEWHPTDIERLTYFAENWSLLWTDGTHKWYCTSPMGEKYLKELRRDLKRKDEM